MTYSHKWLEEMYKKYGIDPKAKLTEQDRIDVDNTEAAIDSLIEEGRVPNPVSVIQRLDEIEAKQGLKRLNNHINAFIKVIQ